MISLRTLCINHIGNSILTQIPSSVVRDTKKIVWKEMRCQLQVDFLSNCHQAKKVPKFLSLHIPLQLRRYSNQFKVGQLKSLRKALDAARCDLKYWSDRKIQHQINCFNIYGEFYILALFEWCKHALNKKYTNMQMTHRKKLSQLNATNTYEKFKVTNTVINLSNVSITKTQHEALSLGLNMTWPNTNKIEHNEEIQAHLRHAFLDIYRSCK